MYQDNGLPHWLGGIMLMHGGQLHGNSRIDDEFGLLADALQRRADALGRCSRALKRKCDSLERRLMHWNNWLMHWVG